MSGVFSSWPVIRERLISFESATLIPYARFALKSREKRRLPRSGALLPPYEVKLLTTPRRRSRVSFVRWEIRIARERELDLDLRS